MMLPTAKNGGGAEVSLRACPCFSGRQKIHADVQTDAMQNIDSKQ
jgi:hypothetical protein